METIGVRAFRSDVSAWNCVAMAAEDTQTYLITVHKGTLEFRMQLCDDVRRMRKELQLAITEGGRTAFDLSAAKWAGSPMTSHFLGRLNRHLAQSPRPSRRSLARMEYRA